MLKFKKFDNNPVLLPNKEIWWEGGAVFNPCAILDEEGVVNMLYRAIPDKYEKKDGKLIGEYISYLGLAKSTDGKNFIKNPDFFMPPSEDYDRYGVEDPRIVKLEGIDEYLITYSAISASVTDSNKDADLVWVKFALASTKDFKTYKKYGVIGPDHFDKDVVIFPEKINGKIALLHRIEPDIQIAYFTDFDQLINPGQKYWNHHMNNLDKFTIMKPENVWEAAKIGAGPTPIKTDAGWLLIYHGVSKEHFYKGGAALFDLEDPSKLIARIPHPILEPTESFETNGDVPNVTFPEGAVVIDGELIVYYGGGDTCVCGASINLQELIDYLLTFKK